MNMLIVDDDPLVLSALRRMMKGRGYDVSTARDPGELPHKHDFDLVVTDWEMPRGGGDAVVKWSLARAPGTPVIIHSGADEIPEMHRTRYVQKGSLERLIEEIERFEELAGALPSKANPAKASSLESGSDDSPG